MSTLKIKKIKPLFNYIITTFDKYVEPALIAGTSIIDANKTKNGVKEYQTVIAVGSVVRDIKPGDMVCVNPTAYAVRKYAENSTKANMQEYSNSVVGYNFNIVIMDDKEYLLLSDRDIDFVIEEYTEE